jgi:GT2 family glycosyltransferase
MNLSVVIPTINEEVLTLDSTPNGVDVNVVREGTLNEARNQGVRQATHDKIVIMDDDISFDEYFLHFLEDAIDRDRLVGLEDWDLGLVAGRVMAFYRETWKEIGGFDERLQSHMGDTDFALNFTENKREIYALPRDIVYHEPHERSITTWDRTWRLGYLCMKWPKSVPRLLRGIAL